MKSVEEYFGEIKTYKLLANKSLGQNFLVNPSIASSIVETLNINSDDKVLEIGAGLGSLSYFLVNKNAEIKLIDIDERMLLFLNNNFSNLSNTQIVRQNILKEDLSNYTKIVGNLPYYITTGIIEHILLNAINAKVITLMTQKEVYPRLLKSNVSPLSIFLNYVCELSNSNNVSKVNFTPVPHIESVYFTLIPNENIKNESSKDLYKLISKLFILRRKTILNSLGNVLKDKSLAKDLLSELNVEENLRPEQLDINFYLNLLSLLKNKGLVNRI